MFYFSYITGIFELGDLATLYFSVVGPSCWLLFVRNVGSRVPGYSCGILTDILIMFQDLRSVFDRDSVCGDGTFTLVTEIDLIDSSFVVNQLLAKHLSIGKCVCLLTTTRSFHHYQQVGNKLGVNLQTYRENGQLSVFESLKKENEAFKVRLIAETNGNEVGASGRENSDLQPLFLEIRDAVEKMKTENRRFSIIIDDLSIWISVGIALKDIVTFIQYCRLLIHRDEEQGALVAVTSLDSLNEDGDLNRLGHLLMHFSDLKISVAELPTGYSKDVHGELTLTWYNRKLNGNSIAERSGAKLHFKIEDKRVLTFPIGTSSAVL